jgi:hypothetical protein
VKSVELNNQQIAYLILSLRHYERKLLDAKGEDMEDAANDLLMIQGLIRKLQEVKSLENEGSIKSSPR